MELSLFKWSGAAFHLLKLQVNQAADIDLARVPILVTSLKACMQIVHSTEASGRCRSEPVLSTETATSRGYSKSTGGLFEPKEGSLELSKICSVCLSALLPHGNHCVYHMYSSVLSG